MRQTRSTSGRGGEPASEADPIHRELLAGWLPAGVTGLASSLTWDVEALDPAERAWVADAVAARRREFATGRVLARRLLEPLGRGGAPLLRDVDRVPRWPAGVVGSISHTRDVAVVVVAASAAWRGIGIDVEPDAPLPERMERRVCRLAERRWVESAEGDERGRRCRLLFSAKEAVYKALFPRLRARWDFHDVEVTIDLDASTFAAALPPSSDVPRIEGLLRRRSGLLLTLALDPAG